jgi:hypothetical protein
MQQYLDPNARSIQSSSDKTSCFWICGSPADSGEHVVKRSDLKSLVGVVSQSDPLYIHTAKRRNLRIILRVNQLGRGASIMMAEDHAAKR